MTFRWPRNDEHAAIVGRNGTGKSQFGAYVLSKRDLKNNINIIIDYKGEELFSKLERAREIGLNEQPDKPGLYILKSSPHLNEETEAWLWGTWEREHRGLFIDEGYMLPDDGAFRAILTQGRSKRIPVITLSQRPVEISRFVFSEASHVALFHLNDERDEKTVRAFTPKGFVEWLPPEYEKDGRLPKYNARWYSIKDDEKFILSPVPEADEIIDAIDSQLEPLHRWF